MEARALSVQVFLIFSCLATESHAAVKLPIKATRLRYLENVEVLLFFRVTDLCVPIPLAFPMSSVSFCYKM